MTLVLVFYHDKNYCPRPFKFISPWLRHQNYKGIVNEAWNIGIGGSDVFQLVNK